jgi:hypothetical protein
MAGLQQGEDACLTLAAARHAVIDGATTRLLATARRAGSTKTEGGLQRIRLARTTVRALGLLADLALALATVALALPRGPGASPSGRPPA